MVLLNRNLFTKGIWYFLFRISHKSNFELIFVYIKKYKSQIFRELLNFIIFRIRLKKSDIKVLNNPVANKLSNFTKRYLSFIKYLYVL